MRSGLLATVLAVLALLAILPGVAAGTSADRAVAPTDEGESVNVTTGHQISAVIATTSDEVRSGADESGFDHRYRNASGDRAELAATRADELRTRAEEIRAEFREAERAYAEGRIDRETLARKIARLSARADRVVADVERLQDRATELDESDLRDAGYASDALRQAVAGLDALRGPGGDALLAHYTGERRGELAIEAGEGIHVRSTDENGTSVRTFDRAPATTGASEWVDHSTALETARNSLSDPGSGGWTPVGYRSDPGTGVDSFVFLLETDTRVGAAVVGVDRTGNVTRIAEETRPLTGDTDRCGAQAAALRATMRTELQAAGSLDARRSIRESYESRIEEARDSCGSLAADRVDRSVARDDARASLPDSGDGHWEAEGSSLLPGHDGNATYAFGFRLVGSDHFGVARVRVDATTGVVTSVRTDLGDDEPPGIPGVDDGVDRDGALAVARSILPDHGADWTTSSVHLDDGVYLLTFEFESDDAHGTAEVRVDAATGSVIDVSETVELVEDPSLPGDDDSDGDRIGRDRARDIARGELTPPETGEWVHAETTLHADRYVVRFDVEAEAVAGVAHVEVDAETGDVMSVEAETSRNSDDPDEEWIDHERAVEAAREALSPPEVGEWTHVATDLDREAGEYLASFDLSGDHNGSAMVRVDALDAEVLDVEEEIPDGSGNPGSRVDRERARQLARDALSALNGSEWIHAGTALDEESEEYLVSFDLSGDHNGSARVRVDALDAEVLAVEESVEESSDYLDPGQVRDLARGALSRYDGEWIHAGTDLDEDSEEYLVSFALDADLANGTADVRVDARNGELLGVEESVEEGMNRSAVRDLAREMLPDRSGDWVHEGTDLADDEYLVSYGLDADDARGSVDVRVDAFDAEILGVEEAVEEVMDVDLALDTALDALPDYSDGDWVHAGTDLVDGEYTLSFDLDANDTDGSATVTLDGFDGKVLEVNETTDGGDSGDDYISEDEARRIARDATSDPNEGDWVYEGTYLDGDIYYVTFDLDSNTHNGSARVEVDVYDGEVLDVFEYIEEK